MKVLTNTQVWARKCFRCKRRQGHAVWNICADLNRQRVICRPCDVSLNNMVLRWARHPQRTVLMTRYRRKVLQETT